MSDLVVLSLGAGVQSSTLALMAAHGQVTPMPDAAVFADTRAEPASVYDWLDWLETKLPFPVSRVSFKDGLTANLERAASGDSRVAIPAFAAAPDGAAPLMRNCTQDYKVLPIRREVRRLLGFRPRQRITKTVEQWIGISLDEVQRMKPARDAWIAHRWPLIEMRMTRGDCLTWMRRHGYPEPPRSACVYCPFHSDAEWRRLRYDEPDAWAEAVRVDDLIRTGMRGTKYPIYLHRSLAPLANVDLTTPEDRGQLSMFGNECEGMCGV